MPSDITNPNIGSAVPLCYGYVRATGMQVVNYTGPTPVGEVDGQPNQPLYASGTQTGIWLLGEGEWDGFDAFWIDGKMCGCNYSGGSYQGQWGTGQPIINFHAGTDTPPGTPLTPSSNGPDQGCDILWGALPPIVNPLCYSGFAYYAFSWLPALFWKSPTLSPVGDWRSTKVRIFDDMGNQAAYGFSTNPAWHFVDAILRKAIVPRTTYNISMVTGPDPLPAIALTYFDWGSIYESAQYFDELLANGSPRFSGSYAFSAQCTLAAVLEQILLCCRSYQQEYAGKLFLNCDKPRPSTFILTSDNLIPFSLQVDDTQVKANANFYTGNFLDLGVPNIIDITTMTVTGDDGLGNWVGTITTPTINPCLPDDIITVGGNSNPVLNALYYVHAATDYTITVYKFAHSGTGTGTGGAIGYNISRFEKRSPWLVHNAHAVSQGQLTSAAQGNKAFKRLSVDLDFANCTFDQQNRLLQYECYRDLGLDPLNPNLGLPPGTEWKPPVQITLSAFAESVDANLNILKQQQCGAIITIDPTASYEFAGEYEIIERWVYPFQQDASAFTTAMETQGVPSGKGGILITSDMYSGTIALLLRTYNPNVFFDVSNEAAAGYATVLNDELWSGPGPVNSGYQIISDTLVGLDEGTTASIAYSGVTVRPAGHIDVSYEYGWINGLAYSTLYYVFVDDPLLAGGPIALQATDNIGDLTGHFGRMYIDYITTPASGGGGTGGGGGGGGGGFGRCFVMGTLVHTNDGVIPNLELYKRWRSQEDIRLKSRDGFEKIKKAFWVQVDEVVRLKAHGCDVVECSCSSTFFDQDTEKYKPAREVQHLDSLDTADGFRVVAVVRRMVRRALVLVLEMEGPTHEYLVGSAGYWTHNALKS